MGFLCGSAGKESACKAGDLGSIPGLGRSPGEERGYPLQYSGLENSMDCIVHRVTKSRTQWSDFYFHFLSFESFTYIMSFSFHHTLMKQAPACSPFYKSIAQEHTSGNSEAGIQTQAGKLQRLSDAIQWTDDHTFLRQTLRKVSKITQEPRGQQTGHL